MLGPLRHAKHRAACGLEDLARAGVDLARDKEWDQDVGEFGEVTVAFDEVVLVAAVGVSGRVGVVFEQIHLAADALFPQARFGGLHEALEDPLPRLVVHHDVVHGVALGGRVLGVTADVEVQPRSVLEEDVARPSPGHDSAEQIPSDFVRTQTALAAQGARDAVFVLDAHDALFH